LRIIHGFKLHYRKQLISKTAVKIGGGLLQDAAQMKLDVLSAMTLTAEPWKLITHPTIKDYFVKCGFTIGHVSSNVASALKLTGDEDDNWYSLYSRSVDSRVSTR
jgi:hypothetical protein